MIVIAPIRREVIADASPDRAFELFISKIGAWWPLARFGVFGDGTVAFEGDEIVERSGDRVSVWAEVLERSAPTLLRVNWHPGGDPDRGTDLRITFTADGDRTLVAIEQSGWERMAEPAAAAEEYGNGWPAVLAGFAKLVENERTEA
jgi:uncharacterized protein YndB with AHSA1/START domain